VSDDAIDTGPANIIERARFGRTGHLSTRVIFGAAAFSSMSQEGADEVIALLDEFEINHLDVAASYGDAELRLAPLLSTRRDEYFLATKTGERSGPAARAELELSLERLGVSQVDLIQLHNLVEPDEWETAHAPGGAVEALVQARDEGLTRFIGVTGHGTRIPGMHLRSLERFDFDTVLFPYNFSLLANPAYRADVEALLDVCAERDVAVQTIKSAARRRWTDPSGDHQSWYEPLRDTEAVGHAVAWVLGRAQLFLNSSSDTTVLRTVLEAAASGPQVVPSDDVMAADVADEGIMPLFDGSELERI
jgi:aryl-alcohol dehydrogenase-like predicted oxidoreductase